MSVSVHCSDNWLIVEACVLLCLLALNVCFVAWDDRLRHAELGDKARRLLARLNSKCCCYGLGTSVFHRTRNFGLSHRICIFCVIYMFLLNVAEFGTGR